jgi:homogentisate 1,2-dioxygenase
MSNKNWLPVRGKEGVHSRQAHADLPAGTYEREVSKEGFFGPAAFLYHARPPTSWVSFEGPLRPRAFDLNGLNEPAEGPWVAPVVLHNKSVEIRFWKLGRPMRDLARNADGDQLLFIHKGEGDLFTDYGRIRYEAGDYLYLPRGTMWRLRPEAETAILMIEATNTHYTLPDRGLLGPHAIFDPSILETPKMDEAFRAHQAEEGLFRVEIKKRGQVSVAAFPYNPLDAVGWHGELAPVRLNVRDIRPVASARYHLPPSAHTTFLSDRFVVCTFTPRPFETDPGAIKVPVLPQQRRFRRGAVLPRGRLLQPGQHRRRDDDLPPLGFTHGPAPQGAEEHAGADQEATDEYAVMIDTRDPLDIGEGASTVENHAYVDSWKAG